MQAGFCLTEVTELLCFLCVSCASVVSARQEGILPYEVQSAWPLPLGSPVMQVTTITALQRLTEIGLPLVTMVFSHARRVKLPGN